MPGTSTQGSRFVGLRRVLFWPAAAILVASGLLVTYVYGATLATSDLHGRCQELYLEQFEDGEVLAARRQWVPPAISCTVRYQSTDRVLRQTRPSEATGFFVVVVGLDAAAVALVGARVRRRARRPVLEPPLGSLVE